MQAKPTILFITCNFSVGGTERHLSTILPLLQLNNFKVIAATLDYEHVLAEPLYKNNIEVYCLISAKTLWLVDKLPNVFRGKIKNIICIINGVRLLRKLKPDIIHFFLPAAYIVGGIAAMLCRFSGKQVMSRRSLNYYQRKHKLLKNVESFLHKRVDYIIGNSLAVIDNLKQEGVEPNKLHLIYNGVDTQLISVKKSSQDIFQLFNLPTNSFIMLKVANLIGYKGHSDLLEALSQIKSLLPQPWYLFCVGRDNGIGRDLQAQAERLQLKRNIIWAGAQENIANFFNVAHLQIVASHEEGFSNAILEGMAAGLPMVVTNVGGNSEAVINEINGLVVAAKDITALSQAILRLANDPQKLCLYKKNAINQAQKFSLEACINNYVKFYNKILADPEV